MYFRTNMVMLMAQANAYLGELPTPGMQSLIFVLTIDMTFPALYNIKDVYWWDLGHPHDFVTSVPPAWHLLSMQPTLLVFEIRAAMTPSIRLNTRNNLGNCFFQHVLYCFPSPRIPIHVSNTEVANKVVIGRIWLLATNLTQYLL